MLCAKKLKTQKEGLEDTSERNEIKLLDAMYHKLNHKKIALGNQLCCTYEDGILCDGSSHCLNKKQKMKNTLKLSYFVDNTPDYKGGAY